MVVKEGKVIRMYRKFRELLKYTTPSMSLPAPLNVHPKEQRKLARERVSNDLINHNGQHF